MQALAQFGSLPAGVDLVVMRQENVSAAKVAATAAKVSAAVAAPHISPAAPLSYLPPPGPPPSTALQLPSIASGHPSTAEDPKVLALSQALEALDVGLAADCLDFAKKLTKEGVLSMKQLKDLPEADAVEVLEVSGMKKLQIRTVMRSMAPPTAPVPASPSPAAAAPRSANAADSGASTGAVRQLARGR